MPLKINHNSRSPSDLAARARELAARAEELASAISALHYDIRAAQNESVRHVGFRCDTARGETQEIVKDLRETASDLDRIAVSATPGTCPSPWGVCPEHGSTLISSAGRAWCRAPSCARTWNYDRVSLPCTEPARWTITDKHGDTGLMCDGHALAAAKHLEGAQAAPLELRPKELA